MSYGGNVNRGPFLNVINWVFNAIALTCVTLRFLSQRMLEKKTWAIDDAFMVLAISINLARAIYVSVTVSMGFGRHLHDLLEESPIATTQLLRLLVILQAIGLWTFTLPKLPMAALLVRLFGTKRKIRIILYSMAGVLVVLAAILTITTFVQCSPIAAQWDLTVKGTCWDRSVNVNLGYLVGSYSAFLDFAFALYPIMQISKLQMERSRKILIAASLSLGFIACITTCYKLTTIVTIEDTRDPTCEWLYLPNAARDWADKVPIGSIIPLEVWNSVEGTALIIAASIPLTKPLMVMVGQGLREVTSRLSSNIPWSTNRPSGSTGPRDDNSRATTNTRDSVYRIRKGNDDVLLQDLVTSTGNEDGSAYSQQTDRLGMRRSNDIYVESSIYIQTQDRGFA